MERELGDQPELLDRLLFVLANVEPPAVSEIAAAD